MNADMSAPAVVLVKDDETGALIALECPTCGSQDIREVDQCIRWNVINVHGDGLNVSQQSSDFETVGFICADNQHDVTIPAELTDGMEWY